MIYAICIFVSLIVLAVLSCNLLVAFSARGKVYRDINKAPENEYGLLLGTLPCRTNGEINPRMTNRVKAMAGLYKAGKVRKVIVSGGTNVRGQNEVEAMHRCLEENGVDGSDIIDDKKGVRTYESLRNVVSAGISQITIVSQFGHCQRAVFIAKSMNVSSVAFAAQSVRNSKSWIMAMREVLAKVKVFKDICRQGKRGES